MDSKRYRVLAVAAAAASALAAVAPHLIARGPATAENLTTAAQYAGASAEAAPVAADPLPSPEAVAVLFGWAPVERAAPAAAPPPAETEKADWIRPLGEMVNGDGIRYLFFKDERSGRVRRLRDDGAPEDGCRLLSETSATFTISLDGRTYITTRRR